MSPPPPLEEFHGEGAHGVRTAVQIEKNGAELAWIAHGGLIYLVSGVSPLKPFEAYRPLFRELAESFRSPTKAELERIEVQRLRVVSAEAGMSVSSLPTRTATGLEPLRLSIMNGVELDEMLSEGFLLKVPLPEIYRPKRPSR